MAETVIPDPAVVPAQSEIRKAWYIKSMQSERVKVLVGTTKESIDVPYDLLAQYSTAFNKYRNALNDTGDEIPLPDVTKATFDDFFIWLHAFKPTILHIESDDSAHVDRALNLAVFAERYQIYHLRNQASDVVRTALNDGQWNITPDMISAVYKVAPRDSALRQLSFLGFVAAEGRKDTAVWRAAFMECPDLGFDFFHYQSNSELYSEGIESGGACRFHDHSDISGWEPQDVAECPYPHGAPRQIPGEVVVSSSMPVAPVRDVVVEDTVVQSESKPVNVPLPPVEEAAEPEPVEIHPTEPSVVESSVDNWPSETTETELVEPETGKFHPHEEPLVEENTVDTWVSQTKEAEPVEVASSVAEEELSYTPVGNARMVVEDKPVDSKVTLRRVSEEKPVEKEPAVEEVSVTETTPVVEESDPVQTLSPSLESVSMQRADSVMSTLDPQSTLSKSQKKRNKKGRRQSQV